VNWIATAILRIENGIVVEHWDVIQDEATEEQGADVWIILSSLIPALDKEPTEIAVNK
jgi:hypothetical protein